MPEPSSSPSHTSPPRPGGPVGRNDQRPADTPFERVLRQAAQRNQRQSFAQRFLRPVVTALADRTESLYKNSNLDLVRFRLLQAGFPAGLRARDFMALKLVSTCLVPAMMTVYIPIFSLILDTSLPPLMWAGILLLSVWLGWRVPDIWLAIVTKKRQTAIQMVLPDMIDLITISVEAGLGLYAAIQRVSVRFDNPLSDEFLRSLQEARLGRTNNEALRDLMRRANVEDLTMFISSLIQAETLGVPIANVLRAQTERLRDKRRQRAREQAQKAPLKMLFPLVFFIFPALFVVILGPAMLRIMDNGLG